MARRYFSSTAQRTTLAADITSTAVTVTVSAVTGFPSSYPYTLIIDQDTVNEEVVTVTNRSGTTLTVTRASDGTSAVSHVAGAVVNHGVSARDFDEANSFINGTAVVGSSMLASGLSLSGVTTVVSPTATGSIGVRQVTVSTAAPSGGADGDVWLVYV